MASRKPPVGEGEDENFIKKLGEGFDKIDAMPERAIPEELKRIAQLRALASHDEKNDEYHTNWREVPVHRLGRPDTEERAICTMSMVVDKQVLGSIGINAGDIFYQKRMPEYADRAELKIAEMAYAKSLTFEARDARTNSRPSRITVIIGRANIEKLKSWYEKCIEELTQEEFHKARTYRSTVGQIIDNLHNVLLPGLPDEFPDIASNPFANPPGTRSR